jgi:hypothetical protein
MWHLVAAVIQGAVPLNIPWEAEVSDLVNKFIVPAASVVAIIIVVGFAAAKSRDGRMDNIREASTTWRELAESREAKIGELERDVKDRDDHINRLQTRNDYLWNLLTKNQQGTATLHEGDL